MSNIPAREGGAIAIVSQRFLFVAGKYRLLGIISHMGRNTECGHYVAHIKKDGRWVLFNDEKVKNKLLTDILFYFSCCICLNEI